MSLGLAPTTRRSSPARGGQHRCQARLGIALLAVVIVVALMATAALTFALLMQESNQTARQFADQQQSQWAVDSAIATLLGIAALPPEQRATRSADHAASFVQSLDLSPVDDSRGALGGDAASDGASDWATAATDESPGPDTDWQTSLSDNQIQFDPTLPGFAIFSWQSSPANASSRVGTSATAQVGSSELELRWGWTHESSKLHLARLLAWEAAGTPASPLLQMWCGLDPQQADLLLDWLDPDDQVRPFGGELSEYAALGVHYRPANQVPASLDSLLLVPQITPTWLFGRRQLSLIRWDQAATSTDPSDNPAGGLAAFSRSQQAQIERDLQPLGSESRLVDRDVLLELGLANRLTVTSRERHVTRVGQPQIPVNHSDLSRLFSVVSTRLDPAAATYVCLARQYGVQEGLFNDNTAQTLPLEVEEIELDFSRSPTVRLPSLVALLDSHVRIPQADGTVRIVTSPWNADGLAGDFAAQVSNLFDQLTVAAEPVSVGRIHWRLADPGLLLLVPGLSPETQQWLLELSNAGETTLGSPAGINGERLAARAATRYQEGQLSRSQWQILEREFTDSGDVFSATIFAHAGDYRAIRWAQVIVDASGPRPQQLYYREFMPPPPTLNAVLATLNENVLAQP